MIRINLLPFRAARKKENVRRQVSIFILSFTFVFIAAFIWHFRLAGKITDLTTRLENTKVQVAKYNKINQEIADIQKKLDMLKKRTAVIEQLDLDRKAPVQLMASLTDLLIPNQMWFTMLDYRDETVRIEGIAMDNQVVADFMSHIEAYDTYKSVKLSSIKHEKLPGVDLNLKSFGVTFMKSTSEQPDLTLAEKTKKK